MIIEASAPTRVDLAGGTIDIWPLYLFHPGASTVNFAINRRASCRIETREDGRIILESRDRQVSFETRIEAIADLLLEERLELISKLVHFFKPTTGFHLIAHSDVPAGAGLAGSSALAIACIGALNRLVGNRYDERKYITIAANIETTVIRVPAGFQDYYSALYGGVSSIHFRPDGIERVALQVDEETLERRIAICYTGEPRLSGTNNWEITKNHIDGDPELFTTPQMDMLVEKALGHGAEAAKVCGAGGGGCIAFLCTEGRREEVEGALREEGVEVLDWKLSREGLVVRES
jgi:D-glycero-alpha-D-manno-heptose-7-phosphate kinase